MRALIFIWLTALPVLLKGQDYYQETHRPQFHFSPESHWMNDPNGLVFHNGEYHLFYQYYPGATVWGPMHWGHAVSRDLLHWEHLPIALYPDSLGYIFSGSAVSDPENLSGFGRDGKIPLIAMFTYHDPKGEKAGKSNFQTQGIAWSLDNGRTWTPYSGNPVIRNEKAIRDFRDPKVFWHKPSSKWVMLLAAGDRVHIYNSADLKEWELTSEFGPGPGSSGKPWECPDLFELPVNTKPGLKKWVMLVSLGNGAPNGGSGTEYFVGSFDGKKFINDNPPSTTLWVDEGTDNYAGVTWNGVPDARRLFIGWMSNWSYAQQVPTEKWRSAMTLPRELGLTHTKDGIRLTSTPVKEVITIRDKPLKIGASSITYADTPMMEIRFEADMNRTTAKKFGLEVSNKAGEKLRIGYDVTKSQYFFDRTQGGKNNFSKTFAAVHYAERKTQHKILRFSIWLDASSAEFFADGGLTTMTEIFFPTEDLTNVRIWSEDGTVKIRKSEAYSLKRTWK